jgi:hypothetical protein
MGVILDRPSILEEERCAVISEEDEAMYTGKIGSTLIW